MVNLTIDIFASEKIVDDITWYQINILDFDSFKNPYIAEYTISNINVKTIAKNIYTKRLK